MSPMHLTSTMTTQGIYCTGYIFNLGPEFVALNGRRVSQRPRLKRCCFFDTTNGGPDPTSPCRPGHTGKP